MKKLNIHNIKGEANIFYAIERFINELVEELAKKGIIELEEEDENE